MNGVKLKMRDITPKYISLKVCEELEVLVAAEAKKRRVPKNEVVVQVLAEFFRRPDLAYVPRDYRRDSADDKEPAGTK